jgi:hypothetical protein
LPSDFVLAQLLRAHRPSTLATASLVLAAHLLGVALPGAAWLRHVASLDPAAPGSPLNAALARLQELHAAAHNLAENSVVLDKYRDAKLGAVTNIVPSNVALRL